MRPTPAPKWLRSRRRRANRRREPSFVTLESDGVILVYGRDDVRRRGRRPARGPSRRHRPDHAAGPGFAPARRRISDRERHDPVGNGPSRRVRDHRRRLCRAVAVLAGRAGIRSGPRRRGVALRHPARPLGRSTAVSGSRPARRLSARRPRRSGGGAQGGAARPRSRRRFRQAALHRLHRSPVRPFAIEHRRLPALSRSLSDRRHRTRRRSRRDRRRGLRRLRPMRRGLPDRRRRLRDAACRCLDAAAAHAAHGLSRGRRPDCPCCCFTTRTMAAP